MSNDIKCRHWIAAVAAALGVAVVAVVAVHVVRPTPASSRYAEIELPHERALEVRFTGQRFAEYRPYSPRRDPRNVATIPLAALATLEHEHQLPDLIAALAVTGNIGRARELSAALPRDAAAESDDAALALAGGHAEQALEHAYRAIAFQPTLTPAWWNLGLAAHACGLTRVARDAFQHVLARGEPGWSDDARAHIASLDRDLEPERAYAAFMARGRAMVAGGPLIDLADVRRFPAFARVYVLEAVRVASGSRIEELRPLARELDGLSGAHTMMALVERTAAAPPELRARFFDRYRAAFDRKLSSNEVRQLIDDLRRAGSALDDMRAGAIIVGNQVDTYINDLTALAVAWRDPWLELVAERVRIKMTYRQGDLRAIPALTAALEMCTTDAWSMRCGQIAQELARQLFLIGRTRDAQTWAERAVGWYSRGVTPTYTHLAQTLLGDIHRNLGRSALARAELEEVILATETTSCALRRHASIALSTLDLERRDFAAVREGLPNPSPEQGCETLFELQGLGSAVDLARMTRDPSDVARARTWIEKTATVANPKLHGFALVASVRLARGHDAARSAELRAWLVAHPAISTDPWRAAIRAWGFSTLISDAGHQRDWATVLQLAASEHPGGANPACAVAISLDFSELTIAARSDKGTIGDQRSIEPDKLASTAIVPPAIAAALAGCTEIAVDARQPLHGRADLLPAELPWFFIGDAPPVAASTGPHRAVEIASPRPPDPSLPPLGPLGPSAAHFDRELMGNDATPTRVLAALADATYAEIHAHGIVSAADDDAAFLALSPDADGTYTLHAAALRKAKLARAPIVVLGACRAATVAAYYQTRWSLPDAFLAAGAHAVVAADVEIPDGEARAVFDELHRRIDAGEPVHRALAAIRAAAPPGSWQRHLMVFR